MTIIINARFPVENYGKRHTTRTVPSGVARSQTDRIKLKCFFEVCFSKVSLSLSCAAAASLYYIDVSSGFLSFANAVATFLVRIRLMLYSVKSCNLGPIIKMHVKMRILQNASTWVVMFNIASLAYVILLSLFLGLVGKN